MYLMCRWFHEILDASTDPVLYKTKFILLNFLSLVLALFEL